MSLHPIQACISVSSSLSGETPVFLGIMFGRSNLNSNVAFIALIWSSLVYFDWFGMFKFVWSGFIFFQYGFFHTVILIF